MSSEVSAPVSGRRRGRGGDTAGRLLAAAEELFSEWGYASVSPGDVAYAAGIGRTTFYEHFTDLEDLLAALVEARMPQVTEQLVAAIPQEEAPTRQLTEFVVRMVEFAVTDPVLGVSLHQGLPALGAGTQARIAAAHHSIGAEFGRIYRAGVAAGELRAMPGDLAGRFLEDLVMAAARTLIELDHPEHRLAEVTDDLVRFLFHGLSAG